MTAKNTPSQPPKLNDEPIPKANKPDKYVYAIVPNGRGNRIGARLGVVFNHKTGGGFTMYLDAIPIAHGGQIEVVAYPPKP